MEIKQLLQPYNVLNIIGYVRRSRQDIEKEKRTGEDTLAEQTSLIDKILMSIELPYDLRSEIGSGENIDGRPVFQGVLKDLEQGKYQAIAVKEISRLSRGNMGDAQRILDLIKDLRLVIVTPYKVYDVRNPTDFRQIRFELFLAREEYEMIKERMVGARYTYAAQGKWVAGKSPFGYSYDRKSQRLTPNEEEAKVVRMIYDMFNNGVNKEEVSYQAIATYLTKLGIETPRGKKTWSYTQVKKILTNDLYIGTIRFKTTEVLKNGKRATRPESEHIIVEDSHEPILDKEIWHETQKKISNKLPQPHNPLNFAPNELASVCTCSVCGGKLIRNCGVRKYKKQNGEESEYVKEFLKCQKNHCMSVKYRDVENAILDALIYLKELNNKELRNSLNAIVNFNNINSKNKSEEKIREQALQKEKELSERMEFVFDKYEKGIYTDEMFLQRKAIIDSEKNELKEILAGTLLAENKIDDKTDLDKVRQNIESVVSVYNNLEKKEEKNELLRSTFKDVTVEVIQKGRGRTPAKFIIYTTLYDDILK